MWEGTKRKIESSDGFEVWNKEWFSLFCGKYAIFVDLKKKKKNLKMRNQCLQSQSFPLKTRYFYNLDLLLISSFSSA